MKLASFFISGLILLAGCQSTVDHDELVDAAPKGVTVVSEEDLPEYWKLVTLETHSKLNYPIKQAKRGYVVVGYLIDKNGNVFQPTLLESQPPKMWDRSALKHLSQLHFKPATTNKERKPVYTSMKILFNLQ